MGSLEVIDTSVLGSGGNIAVTCTYRQELSSAPTIRVSWDKPGSATTSNCGIEAFDEFDPGGATVLAQLVSGSAAVAGEYQSARGDSDTLRPYFTAGTKDLTSQALLYAAPCPPAGVECSPEVEG